ncbi:uncharacterized protein [Pempheris klunzingeri]|uniref:uncharacterized protein isoform X2 n=1 Tax=Pempheris klunzingeri TaxID=3127111 RepID=UPI00397EC034
MFTKEICLYLLLGHLVKAGVGSGCVPVQCLICDIRGETSAVSCSFCSNSSAQCVNVPPDSLSNCKKDFQVSVNGTGSAVEEGEAFTLTCDYNLPPLDLTFGWKRDGVEIHEGQNKSQLVFKKALSHNSDRYSCFVNSTCGLYESPPHNVTVNGNNVVILVICGVSALALIVVMGLAMKFKLKRDNAKLKERMKQQRAQAAQSGVPSPFTHS